MTVDNLTHKMAEEVPFRRFPLESGFRSADCYFMQAFQASADSRDGEMLQPGKVFKDYGGAS